MGQFELCAINNPPIAFMSVAACQASGKLSVHLVPRKEQRLSMTRYATSTATEISTPSGIRTQF